MRLAVKCIGCGLLLGVLGAPVFITGCKTQNTTVNEEQQPSDYSQWEHDTHREHQDYNKRSPEEQQQYRDWQRSHGQQH